MKKFDAVIIFVVDQPFLNSLIIKTLVREFNQKNPDIAAFQYNGEQINPVLFSKTTFNELERLTIGQSGKTIFPRFSVFLLETKDEKMAMDIDTEEDYSRVKQELKSMFP